MIFIDNANQIKLPIENVYRNRTGVYSDTIYTFDIETTSLFYINGKWQGFDKSINDYSNIPKCAVPYVGMFGVNDTVYYFNNMYLFGDILEKVSSRKLSKFIYIHNAGYEFQFMREIFDKYDVVDMVARKPRAPIQFKLDKLNIFIRCSYALTGLSLADSAKNYTNIEKKVGDLDYSILRSPLSVPYMTEKEKGYIEYDILTLSAIVRTFRNRYKHIKNIPLTATGEMRRAYSKITPSYHNKVIKKMIPTVYEYNRLRECFAGGISKPNYLYAMTTYKGVYPWDIASSYPVELLRNPYPMSKFRKVPVEHNDMYNDKNYAKIYVLKLKNVSCNKFNTYLQKSKCRNIENAVVDNGRIICCDSCEITYNEIDFELLNIGYDFEYEILELWVAIKKYLPKYFLEFILKLYESKTRLKGAENDFEKAIYFRDKGLLNACYGACVTNIVKSSILYCKDDEKSFGAETFFKWSTGEFNDELIKKKLEELQGGYKNLFNYSWGVWCTSYSRRHLLLPILEHFDDCVLYYDTDSHKNADTIPLEEQRKIYEKYDRQVDKDLLKMCSYYGIDFRRTRPKDRDGIEHPIGHYELELKPQSNGEYYPLQEFKTLGSKRYCYRDEFGKLKMVVAGVGKVGVNALKNDINNFNEDLFFDYDTSGKLCSYYIDNQQPIDFIDNCGNLYHSEWKYSIALSPTTYTMSLPPLYDLLDEEVTRRLSEDVNFLELYKKEEEKRNERRKRK